MNLPFTLALSAPSLGVAEGSGGVDVFRVMLALGLCVVLGVAAAWLLRFRHRLAVQRPGSTLQVVQSVRIDARTSVHLVRCGDSEHLLACGPGGVAITPVARDESHSEGARSRESGGAFQQRTLVNPLSCTHQCEMDSHLCGSDGHEGAHTYMATQTQDAIR